MGGIITPKKLGSTVYIFQTSAWQRQGFSFTSLNFQKTSGEAVS